LGELAIVESLFEQSIVHDLEHYDTICLFARGGMAQVYLARTKSKPSRLVAIKTLEISALDDPDRIAMFADEMRIARMLRHPNIVEMVEAGIIEGEPYLVLEFIDGPSLRDLAVWGLKRGKPVDPRIVVSMIVGACAGLHYAHELQNEWGSPLRLVHRDISPQNLMINRQGVVKVLDFGVAKTVGQRHNTLAQGVKGKMAYTAPEYIRGVPPDRRADIFGLGVVLWEMLANRRLFFRSTVVATMQAVVYDRFPTMRQLGLQIPPHLEHVVHRALDRNVDRRWESARAFGQALIEAAEDFGGIMSPYDLALELAVPIAEIMPNEEELHPDMSDRQLSRGSIRSSLSIKVGDQSGSVAETWASMEIDLNEIGEFAVNDADLAVSKDEEYEEYEEYFDDDDEDEVSDSGTVVDIRPPWIEDEEI
jgi:serine/threonine protein kinase